MMSRTLFKAEAMLKDGRATRQFVCGIMIHAQHQDPTGHKGFAKSLEAD